MSFNLNRIFIKTMRNCSTFLFIIVYHFTLIIKKNYRSLEFHRDANQIALGLKVIYEKFRIF